MNTWQPRCDLCGRGAGPSGLCPTHREQQRRQRLSWRMEDALDLLDDGEHPERVARRLGTTVAALEIQCRRSGNPRPELTRERDQRRRQRARVNTTATSDLSTEQASDWARMEPTKTAPASAGNTPEGLAPQPNAPEGGWHQ